MAPGVRSKLVSASAGRLRNGGVLVRRHALDPELRSELGGVMPVDGDAGRAQRLAQPLHLALGLDPQRIVGDDPQHEVDAALEVEAELELLVHQPLRRGDAEAIGDQVG